MTTNKEGAHADAERFAQVSALIGRYPDLSDEEVALLKSWFMREASAYDVAMLASKEEIRTGYTSFRKDHVDRLGGKDILIAVAVLVAVLGCLALIALAAS